MNVYDNTKDRKKTQSNTPPHPPKKTTKKQKQTNKNMGIKHTLHLFISSNILRPTKLCCIMISNNHSIVLCLKKQNNLWPLSHVCHLSWNPKDLLTIW